MLRGCPTAVRIGMRSGAARPRSKIACTIVAQVLLTIGMRFWLMRCYAVRDGRKEGTQAG